MPPMLLCWPTRSEVGVGAVAVKAELPTNTPLNFVAV